MVASNRTACASATLDFEARGGAKGNGGYTNHPSDPGGPTKWGITLADARLHWKRDAMAADVRDMPLGVAMGIYLAHYWNPLRCDDLAAGVDFATFDYGVNSGIGRSAKVLQRILGVPVDGRIGDLTVAAARQKNAVELIKAIYAERTSFLRGLKTWVVFGRGWLARCVKGEAIGVKMALDAKSVLYTPADVTDKLKTESKAAATKSKIEATKAGGAVGAPASTQIPDAPHHLDWTALPAWSLWAIGAVVAAVVIVCAYRAWIHRQRAAAYAEVAV